MNRCILASLYTLAFFALIGTCILMAGIGTLPTELTLSDRMDPITGQLYSLEEQNRIYRQILVNSAPFKILTVGACILGISIVSGILLYLYKSKCISSNKIEPTQQVEEITARIHKEPSPLVKALTPKASDLDPTDPLQTHSVSTMCVQPQTARSRRRVSWNQVRKEHLEGRTTLV